MPSSPPPSSPPGRRGRPRDVPLPCRHCRHRPSTPPCRRRRKSSASPSPSSLHLPSPPSSHHHPHQRRSWQSPPRYRDRLWRGTDRPAAGTITSPPPSVLPRRHSCCPLMTVPAGSATTSSLSPDRWTGDRKKMRKSCDVIFFFLGRGSLSVTIAATLFRRLRRSLIFRRISGLHY